MNHSAIELPRILFDILKLCFYSPLIARKSMTLVMGASKQAERVKKDEEIQF